MTPRSGHAEHTGWEKTRGKADERGHQMQCSNFHIFAQTFNPNLLSRLTPTAMIR